MASRRRKPELHIEVLLKDLPDNDDSPFPYVEPTEIGLRLKEYLELNHAGFRTKAHIWLGPDMPHASLIEHVRTDDYSGPPTLDDFHSIGEVTLRLHVYRLHPLLESVDGSSDRQPKQASERMIVLPSKVLATAWDSLMFDTIDRSKILNSIVRMIVLTKQPGWALTTLNPNRIILLHGPPGCGKTTLCRALAQKLCIRLSSHFQYGRLFEINTQSFLSKYYSESGRLVTQVFERITQLAQDKSVLVCMLIDEVESIASSREQMTESGECHDSIRATNQLLTALDRIRYQSNVVMFCTSNMKTAIDKAFLDRVDYQVCIPPPCESAIYEILRTTLNELIRYGLITSTPCDVPDTVLVKPEDRIFIPSFEKLIYLADYPECPAKMVATLTKRCKGFSGRKLKKLPLLAITLYTWGETCPLDEALDALKIAIEKNSDASGGEEVLMVE